MKEHYNQKWVNRFGASAMTFGSHVCYDCQQSEVPQWLRNHEKVHTEQYKKYGLIGFLVLYLYQYLNGRCRGLSHWDAYNNITFEMDAVKAEGR